MLTDSVDVSSRRLGLLHDQDRRRVTASAFTDVLRHQYGEDIVAIVIHSVGVQADPVTAGYLDVEAGSHITRRKAVLRTAGSRRVATYAQSFIVDQRLADEDRQAVLRCDDVPLGDLLHVDQLRRRTLDWQIGSNPPYPGGRYLAEACTPGWPIVSRHTILSAECQPLAMVSEWWPQFNPHSFLR